MARPHNKAKRKAWNLFADGGRALLVETATALPGRPLANRARLSAGSCLMAIKILTTILKTAIPERRPDGEDDKSFPSEHAAECVAAAIIIDHEYPGRIGAAAYGLAAAVALARIESKKHRPRDVFAGGLIGSASFWIVERLSSQTARRIFQLG